MNPQNLPQPQVETYITVNKKRQQVHAGNTVYLNNNVEFEIEFFNTTTKTLVPSIKINSEKFSSSPVIYPAQKFYLEDFISINRKLLFISYTVENTTQVQDIIKDNGVIEIKYYYEKEMVTEFQTHSKSRSSLKPLCDAKFKDVKRLIDGKFKDVSKNNESLETGKIMKGTESNARYKTVSIHLDDSYFEFLKIQLLPMSRKPKTSNCPKCKSTQSTDSNFCSSCGQQLLQYLLK